MQKTTFSISTLLFLCLFSVAHATDYNYLPADVGIKQNEALSALEYRLQTLEAQIANSPQVSVDTINARIKALEAERDTEKRYVTGLYGSYGIGNQLDAKLAEIDAKYDAQISELEDEKDEHSSEVSALAKAEKEAEKLRQQILELQKQNLSQIEEYQELLDEQMESYSTPEVFTDADIYEGFVYMDSLSLADARDFFGRIKASRPDISDRIAVLYYQKYPNGKEGTAQHDEYLESLPKEVSVVSPAIAQKPLVTPDIAPPEPKELSEVLVAPTTTPVTQLPVVEEIPTPEQPQEDFVQKVVGFFKQLMFWR
ncbi:hypothetical protein IPH92_02400 [Candidatus Kaiserbacteria bacterium]|nr:MAG: hypothetical protein IPH92_02400 [Candidatus Kaiserbacteria bacterium]